MSVYLSRLSDSRILFLQMQVLVPVQVQSKCGLEISGNPASQWGLEIRGVAGKGPEGQSKR